MQKRMCKECGKEFILSDGEIQFYTDRSLSVPKRCKECREKNKSKKENEMSSGLKPYKAGLYSKKTNTNYKNNKYKKNNIWYILGAILALIIFLLVLVEQNPFLTDSIPDTYTVSNEDVIKDELEINLRARQENTYVEEDFEVLSPIEGQDLEEIDLESQETIYRFASTEKRNDHFKKHGDEFNYGNALEYELGASEVINNSEVLHKTEAEDGDDVYYLESTNEIVFVSKAGIIRTYFKPDDGIAYYNRQ